MDPVSVQPAADALMNVVTNAVWGCVQYLIVVGFALAAFDAAVDRVVWRAKRGQFPPRFWR